MQHTRKFTGVYNFRDLATNSKGKITPGKIFRSATPSEATKEETDYIINDLKVKTIIDLRTPVESAQDQGEKLLRKEFTILSTSNVFNQYEVDLLRKEGKKILFHLPVLPSNISFLRELSNKAKAKLVVCSALGLKEHSNRIICDMMVNLKLQGLYRLMLKTSWRNILRVLEIVSDPASHPVLIHCTQGKDRTGMVSALIMHCCHVPIENITEDYCLSEKELEPLRLNPTYMKHNFPKAEQLGLDMTSWMLAPKEAFEFAMDWLKLTYGSPDQYLDWIGFGSRMRARLVNSVAQGFNAHHFREYHIDVEKYNQHPNGAQSETESIDHHDDRDKSLEGYELPSINVTSDVEKDVTSNDNSSMDAANLLMPAESSKQRSMSNLPSFMRRFSSRSDVYSDTETASFNKLPSYRKSGLRQA